MRRMITQRPSPARAGMNSPPRFRDTASAPRFFGFPRTPVPLLDQPFQVTLEEAPVFVTRRHECRLQNIPERLPRPRLRCAISAAAEKVLVKSRRTRGDRTDVVLPVRIVADFPARRETRVKDLEQFLRVQDWLTLVVQNAQLNFMDPYHEVL